MAAKKSDCQGRLKIDKERERERERERKTGRRGWNEGREGQNEKVTKIATRETRKFMLFPGMDGRSRKIKLNFTKDLPSWPPSRPSAAIGDFETVNYRGFKFECRL